MTSIHVAKPNEYFSFFFAIPNGYVGSLVPRPRMELVASAVEAQRLNQWTTREVPIFFSFYLPGHYLSYPPICYMIQLSLDSSTNKSHDHNSIFWLIVTLCQALFKNFLHVQYASPITLWVDISIIIISSLQKTEA